LYWENVDLKFSLLQRCLAVLILSGNTKGSVKLPENLCKYLCDQSMFKKTWWGGKSGDGNYFLDGFSMIEYNEAVWLPEVLKTLEKFVTDNGGSLFCLKTWFDGIFTALRENGYEEKLGQEITDLRDTYEGFAQTKVDYSYTRLVEVESTNRTTDNVWCYAQYEKLVNGGYKSIGSYLYVKAKLRSSLLLKNWHQKGETHRKFLGNSDLLFEFGFSGELSCRNLDVFSANTELLTKIQEAFVLLYKCYYQKQDLKSLDFHFIWNSFLEIQKVKSKVVEGIRAFDITESFGGPEMYGKMFEVEKKGLGVVVEDL